MSFWVNDTGGGSDNRAAAATTSTVDRAYLKSNLLHRRRQMLTEWADFCCQRDVMRAVAECTSLYPHAPDLKRFSGLNL